MTDLRDYQAAAVEQIERAGKALYVLPTGGARPSWPPTSLKDQSRAVSAC